MTVTPEKEALFNEKFTHVGIQCGCHIETEDFCCFMYGTNVKDKDGIKLKHVLNVPKENCDESQPGWHEGPMEPLKIDENSGAQKADVVVQAATPAAPARKKRETYEALS